jgi:uncharacterized protein with HEPN domain
MQIGELTTHLTNDFKQTYTGMPWTHIKALRNVVAHSYCKIDVESLWETIFPLLAKQKSHPLRDDFRSHVILLATCSG